MGGKIQTTQNRARYSPKWWDSRMIARIAAGTSIPATMSRCSTIPRAAGRRVNQTPGTPTPSMAREIERNAQWYQSTTLNRRMIVTWSIRTLNEASRMQRADEDHLAFSELGTVVGSGLVA